MSKNKKMVKQIVAEVLETMFDEMEHKHPTALSAEAKELIEDDSFRTEAYCKLEGWVKERLSRELESLNQRVDVFIEEAKKDLKKSEKRQDKMEYDIKQIKKDSKSVGRTVTDLEKSDKHEKQILTQIAVSAGAVSPGASFKEVRKGYRNWVNKSYSRRIPDNNRYIEEKSIFDV